MPRNTFDSKWTLVQVMTWCHQATSHYLNQCCSRSMSPYGVTKPHWVNHFCSNLIFILRTLHQIISQRLRPQQCKHSCLPQIQFANNFFLREDIHTSIHMPYLIPWSLLTTNPHYLNQLRWWSGKSLGLMGTINIYTECQHYHEYHVQLFTDLQWKFSTWARSHSNT